MVPRVIAVSFLAALVAAPRSCQGRVAACGLWRFGRAVDITAWPDVFLATADPTTHRLTGLG